MDSEKKQKEALAEKARAARAASAAQRKALAERAKAEAAAKRKR